MPLPFRKPIFVVPLEPASVTGPAAAGYPASHLGRLDALALTWRNTGGGAVTFNFAEERAVDFVALVSTNAKPETTIRVQAGSFDSGVGPLINPAITRGDKLYHSHTELPSPQSVTSVTVTVSHSGQFEAAFLIIGRKAEPAKFYDYGFEFGAEDTGKAEITPSGVWDKQDGVILRTLGLTLNWQSESEWEGVFRPIVETVGITRPIFVCFDPAETAYRQNRTYYGTFRKSPVATGRRKPRTYGGDYQVQSII